MRVALMCSGLGRVRRGHEVFAQDLFDLLSGSIDVTVFKGGGEPAPRQLVIPNIPRDDPALRHIRLPVSPKWLASMQEQERLRVEAETFTYAALKPLLDGGYDVIHCLEQEVCRVVYRHRHVFEKTPRILFSNGGAIPAPDLPPCDFVQEYTPWNLARGAAAKAFVIPHGVDCQLFRPGIATDFRSRHGIPPDAFVVLSVGAICYWHKRMDYVIEEVARLDGAYLVIVGQETTDTAAIKRLGEARMGKRAIFTQAPHEQLPQIYAAADVFALGSLFEAFGIVYIEAMAMGLPVACTRHPNQVSIVEEGLFVDMSKPGALASALRDTGRAQLTRLGARGREIAVARYDLPALRTSYIERYGMIAASPSTLPAYSLRARIRSNVRNALRPLQALIGGDG